MRKIFMGAVVEKDGMLCLKTASNCWFPLDGDSRLAEDFREAFGRTQRIDVGKQVYRVGDVLQMENDAQRREREESGR